MALACSDLLYEGRNAIFVLILTPALRSTSTAITSSISSVPVANNASTVFDIVRPDEYD